MAARTDAGRLSDYNEDHFVARKDLDLYLVADGVGGLEAGELASQVACQLVEQAVRRDLEAGVPARRHDRVLANAVQEANRGLYDYGRTRPDRRGIGTTLTALWFHGDRVLFAYVGDSRICLFRDGRLRPLSRDEKAGRYRLAASLGQAPSLDVHLGMVRLRAGDRFLLSTDGLHGQVDPQETAAILDDQPQPHEACQRLVARANEAGGADNVTALVAHVERPDPPQPWRFSRVRFDATSPLARLCRRRVLVPAGVGVALALVALVLATALPRGSDERRAPSPAAGLAPLVHEVNRLAAEGRSGAATDSLKALLLEAVRRDLELDPQNLGLEPAARQLWTPAAAAAWAELTAPARRHLEPLEGSPAGELARTRLAEARQRLERAEERFRSGDCRAVADAVARFEQAAAQAVQRARSDIQDLKVRIADDIAVLGIRAADFPPESEMRRQLERRIEQARQALDRDELDAARAQVRAARRALSGEGPE
ncbi:MAG: PP2C family protein-serine/threonine phosphatase [Candidatus Brocadiia bacterium]